MAHWAPRRQFRCHWVSSAGTKNIQTHSEDFSEMINNLIFRMIIFNFRTPACSVRWGLVIHWLPTVDNEAYFINPRFLSTSPPPPPQPLKNYFSPVKFFDSTVQYCLKSSLLQQPGWAPGPTSGKINQQRQTFSCIGRSSKKYHIEYTTSKSLEYKISGNLSSFFIKFLQYLWTSFKTIC